jgi:hypothetical protein
MENVRSMIHPEVARGLSPGGRTTSDRPIPELWTWAEYYCPLCYVAAVRLHRVQ